MTSTKHTTGTASAWPDPTPAAVEPLKCVWSGVPGEERSCPSCIPTSVVVQAWQREMQLSGAKEGFFHFSWRAGIWLGYGLRDGGVRGVYCPTHCSERELRGARDPQAGHGTKDQQAGHDTRKAGSREAEPYVACGPREAEVRVVRAVREAERQAVRGARKPVLGALPGVGKPVLGALPGVGKPVLGALPSARKPVLRAVPGARETTPTARRATGTAL